MLYYYCDCCHYCFRYEVLPERCPDCGKDYQENGRKAVRVATNMEREEQIRVEKECEEEDWREDLWRRGIST